MNITEDAKQLLKQIGAEGVRLSIDNSGDGPQVTLSLEAPHEFDRVQTISGLTVAFDPAVTGTDGLTLDKEENENGVGLVLL